jgi:hypothetical protein
VIAARSPDLFPNGALIGSTDEESWSGPSPPKRIEFLLVVVLPLVVAGLILWLAAQRRQPPAGAHRRGAKGSRSAWRTAPADRSPGCY